MSRNALNSISLASLAASVSATALLGVSSMASAEDPWYCKQGYSCTTDPADDPISYWSHDGECIYGNGGGEGTQACSCAARAGSLIDGVWTEYYVISDVAECYGG